MDLKNTYGVDLFELGVTQEGLKPSLYSRDFIAANGASSCFYSGVGCGQWIVDNDNVDYLKASHDQNNSTTGICNNDCSKQLGYNAGQVRSCK